MVLQPNVWSLLSGRARLTPGRVGVVEAASGRRFTYGEVYRRAAALAAYLEQRGIRRGDRIAIWARNRMTYSDLLFGAAKLGAIVAPFNFRLAVPEAQFIAADAGLRLVFYEPEFEAAVQAVPGSGGATLEQVRLDEEWEAFIEEGARAAPLPPPSGEAELSAEPEDPFALLYTSGTTGRPKGAIISHRQAVWNTINTVMSWELTAEDVAPVFTPMFHSGGINIFFLPLVHVGGRTVLTREFNVDEALDLIEGERCTAVFMVPTMLQMVADHPRFASADFGSVRFFVSGGAPCPVGLIRRYQARGLVFRQGYGLTEAGVNCFSMTDEESVRKAGSVGRPILHSAVRLVGPDGRDVAPGEVGELWIAGPHVCSGYWQRPEETARSFEGPFFKTGDLARMDEDGFFYIVGRLKEMFISGGENVYPAEVEAVLANHPAVAEVAVVGVPDARWGEVGMAVVVLRPGASLTLESLRAYCEGKLARYKIPKHLAVVDALPRNAYGKVVKHRLVERLVSGGAPA